MPFREDIDGVVPLVIFRWRFDEIGLEKGFNELIGFGFDN